MLAVGAQEQLFVYELNRARHDPVAYQREQSLPVDLAYVAAKPPLAVNASLMNSARFKSTEMATSNYVSHQSQVTGKWPNQLVREFGYALPSSLANDSNQVESICGGTFTSTAIVAMNQLIVDAGTNPPGHRNHLLSVDNANREIGVGFAANASSQYANYWTIHSTDDLQPGSFLTGVVYRDLNGNSRYDDNEGLGGVTVTISPTLSVTTNDAGGWSARVVDGSYTVTASGAGYSGTSVAPVRVGGRNVELDFVSGQRTGWIDFTKYENHAPTLDVGPDRTASPVFIGQSNPPGTVVDTLLAEVVTDQDVLSTAGIAVVATSSPGGGRWQYSRDGGGSWTDFGVTSQASARLLGRDDRVRFLPTGASVGTASISYRAWDQTDGTAGQVVDASVNVGGTSAFSAQVETASVVVVSVNHAPTLLAASAGRLDSVAEDDANAFGTSVATIMGSSMNDLDPGTQSGMAVVGVTGTANGTWQYSIDVGKTWKSLDGATAAAAILLNAGDRLRFIGRRDFNGVDAGSVVYRAWDQSSGSPGQTTDTSLPSFVGGQNAFSVTTASASVTVVPVNDAPVVVANTSAFKLNPVPVNSRASDYQSTPVAKILGNGFWDADAGGRRGIAVIGFDGHGRLYYVRDGWVNGNSAAPSPDSAWLLKDTDQLLFEPDRGFSGSATVTFRLWDQSSGTAGFGGANLDGPSSVGGTTAFSVDTVSASIFVGPGGTPPTATFGIPSANVDGSRSAVAITFSADVTGLDVEDFTLTRDGVAVRLDGAVLSGSGTAYTLGNLGAATSTGGRYVLKFATVNSGVADARGNAPSADAQISWNMIGVPSVPTGLVATPGNGQVLLSWRAPSTNGGSPVTDYLVQYAVNGSDSWTNVEHVASTATTRTVAGLVNGASYVFRVAAVNAGGNGEFVQSASVTPAAVPALTSGLTALPGDRTVALSWGAPSSDGGSPLVNYLIQYRTSPAGAWSNVPHAESTATSITVGDLANGTLYGFRVAAVNVLGPGSFGQTVEARPGKIPGAPANVVAEAGDGRVAVSWRAPSDNGGSPVVDYLVQISGDNGQSWAPCPHPESGSTAITISGLVNGTSYMVRVAAVNGMGRGEFACSTAVVPSRGPGGPLILSVTALNGGANLSWLPPVDSGGSQITDYVVQYSADGARTWTVFPHPASPATSLTVSGLANGTSYLFRVAAVNNGGVGQAVNASNKVTPLATVMRPPSATGGGGYVALGWTPVTTRGRPAITAYVIRYSSNGGVTWTTSQGRGANARLANIVLPAGVGYVFQVAPVVAGGLAPFSGSSIRAIPYDPSVVPGQPGAVTARASKGVVTLRWVSPSPNAGGPVVDYVIQQRSDRPGAIWVTCRDGISAAPTATIRLRPVQQVLFRVAAKNVAGVGVFSDATGPVQV